MPRPRKQRYCRRYRADRVYKPQGIPLRDIETTSLSLDEFEALRLCDGEGMDQTAAGESMGVSRGTVQRLLKRARQALVRGILQHHAIVLNLTEQEDGNACLYPDT